MATVWYSESDSCRVKRFLKTFSSPNSEFFESKIWFQTDCVGFENGPPFFLLPSDSLNQSQFAQPSLKPVDTKGFTKHIAVCLKHTQTPGSDRFSGKIRRFQSEF